MAKALIIGAGPAGISAALYARRGGLDVAVVAKGGETGALAKTEKIENYYGFPEPISGAELARRGIAGATRLGVRFYEDEIFSLAFGESGAALVAEGKARHYEADAVVLAAGAARRTLPVAGLREFEGKGVSYCAVCDAFFYRAKEVAVIGAGEYALHEAQILLPHAAKVTLLTNGAAPSVRLPEGIALDTRPLAAIQGAERVERVAFADGASISADGIFLAIGVAGSVELARKIGAFLDGTNVKVDAKMATNVPGLYAAGDCTGGLLQIAKAVHEGAQAGLSVLNYVHGKQGEQ